MRKKIVVSYIMALLLTLILAYDTASSAEFEFNSNTYLQFKESTRNDKYVPLYEYLDLGIKDIKEGKLNLYFAGWLRYDLRDLRDDNRERDELTYAYLNYNPLNDKSLIFNVGRHLVFGGVASEQLDGISARWEITPSTGISLYGGVPVETEIDSRQSDYLFGGRVFHKFGKRAEFGFSYLKEQNEGVSYREELGIDLWSYLSKGFEVQGQSFYNNITDGWQEHSYNLRIHPVKKLMVTAFISYIDYNDAFSSANISAFSPDYWGEDEKMSKIGGLAEYTINNDLSLAADYRNYNYKTLGSADYFGFTLSPTLYGIKSGLSLHRMSGYSEKLRYVELRAYAVKSFQRLKFALDAINVHYDEAINDLKNAYSISGTLGYKLRNYLSLSFNLDYGKNPDFTHEIKSLFKIALNFK
jgi:hypothetical protein